ncbi:MAG: transcriptional repressor NrdR [Ruminococcaceae bacterium]|nr:transcriptional repressor NrdR [Oscillospiraceae bacterium]
MKCPFCSYDESKVIDSRPGADNTTIRRRRLCPKCGKRFTTYESFEISPVTVIKKDGSREQFDKNKVFASILRACAKRHVTRIQIENISKKIEQEIGSSLQREVTSTYIGELVMEELRSLDEVAYVRFASVYREFEDVSDFMRELERLAPRK